MLARSSGQAESIVIIADSGIAADRSVGGTQDSQVPEDSLQAFRIIVKPAAIKASGPGMFPLQHQPASYKVIQ